MPDDEAWRAEERFWTGGPDHYGEALGPACVMAIPLRAGSSPAAASRRAWRARRAGRRCC